MALSWKHLLLIFVILLGIIFGWVAWQGTVIRKESEYHEFRYEVKISAESVLENVTLLLPVPFVGNTSLPGESLVKGAGYGIPPDWRLSLEQVNDTPMLRILAEKFEPEYHGLPIPIEPGSTPVVTPLPAATAYSSGTPILMPLEFGISQRVERSVDTRDPPGREPLLSIPELLRPVPCPGPFPAERCYEYPAPIFVHYSSDKPGNLTLTISNGGTNQWWLGGWTGNSYGEDILVTLENGRQGWIQGKGFLSTGSGRY